MSTFAISSQAPISPQNPPISEKRDVGKREEPLIDKDLRAMRADHVELHGQVEEIPKEEVFSEHDLPSSENTEESGLLKNENSWKEIRELVQQVKSELRQQQLEQLLHLIDKTDGKAWESISKDGHGNTTVIQIMVLALEKENTSTNSPTPESVDPETVEEAKSQINSYWNAENTANRIVGFAMRFAESHGENPEEFAETIKGAIEQGFGEAMAITGELPGAAGKLNRETHDLTFKKLQEKLDAWMSSLYNDEPSTTP